MKQNKNNENRKKKNVLENILLNTKTINETLISVQKNVLKI